MKITFRPHNMFGYESDESPATVELEPTLEAIKTHLKLDDNVRLEVNAPADWLKAQGATQHAVVSYHPDGSHWVRGYINQALPESP